MRHPHLLHRNQAVLLIIDVQESFRKHIPDFPKLLKNISILIEASKMLEVPVLVTEQYPKGLGNVVEEISRSLEDHIKFEKSFFSCCHLDRFMRELDTSKRKQIVVTGIEAHVCVCQTVLDLIAAGYTVHLVTDAVSSRYEANKEIAIKKMLSAGAIPSSVEMAIFEMLVESQTDTFKAVQRLVK